MNESRAAYPADRRVLVLLGACLTVAFAALLLPAPADAQTRPLRKPCLDPKRTLTINEVGGSGAYTAREPLEGCVTPQSGATTFTAQMTCTFHCQHWHTWISTGVPLPPNIQLSATPPAGLSLLRWDNCTPQLGQPRADCTVRLGTSSTYVTARYGPPETNKPSAPGAGVPTAGSYSATIRWSSSTDDSGVAGYDIFRSGHPDAVARVGPGATSAVVRDLFCRTPYTLWVEAFDASGNSERSADINIVTGKCGPTSRPNTTLHLVPPKRTRSRTAFFHFGTRGTVRATKYQCKLDRGRWTRCSGTRGKRYRNLKPGTHTFRVRAGNSLGFDRTPAAYRWVVRR